MQHIYVSPHLDDAMFSCGGLIRRQRAADEPVAVLTLCAGWPTSSELPPLAQHYHAAWGNQPDVVSRRRAEDAAVLRQWGVTAHHGDTPDSIYRRLGNDVLYPDAGALFAQPHPREVDILLHRWQQEFATLFSDPTGATVYAPLAAANHVDHQLARMLGARLLRDGWHVWFYEDYPHAEAPGALHAARAWFGPAAWAARTVPIDVDARIAAIRGYKTQTSFVFGNEFALAERVRRFTAEVACDISRMERVRQRLAGAGGRRERLWRAVWGYGAHAERIWSPTDG